MSLFLIAFGKHSNFSTVYGSSRVKYAEFFYNEFDGLQNNQ